MLPYTSSPSNASLSPCDVFATACELRTQLTALEGRIAENERVGAELVRQRAELTESVRELETGEDNEKQATQALRDELERLRQEAGENVPKFTFQYPKPSETKENDAEHGDAALEKPARLFARNVIPEAWRRQLGLTAASNAKDYVCLADGEAKGGSAGLGTDGGMAKARMVRRMLSQKVKEAGWKSKARKTRRESKPAYRDGARLTRKKAHML